MLPNIYIYIYIYTKSELQKHSFCENVVPFVAAELHGINPTQAVTCAVNPSFRTILAHEQWGDFYLTLHCLYIRSVLVLLSSFQYYLLRSSRFMLIDD